MWCIAGLVVPGLEVGNLYPADAELPGAALRLMAERVSTRCPCRVAGNQFAGQLSDLVILYTSEFLVLQPEITLDDLSRSQEPQDGNIAFC